MIKSAAPSLSISMKQIVKTKMALFGLILAAQNLLAAPQPITPTGKDGQPLNLDFEAGSLKDWKAEGKAFGQQPMRGDTIAQRRADMKSEHQGQYWIGTFEIGGDDLKGTLTSVPFKATHPWASFLIAGGNWSNTRIELVEASTQKVFFKASGEESENLRPVVVNLREQQGKEIFIRVIDDQTGHWGHINFDNFKFYSQKPEFPNTIDAGKQTAQVVPEADNVLYAGLSPEDAVAKMTLPPGFKATLFAGEPDVMQPIAFAIDDRGRLWVAEAYTYPNRAKDGEGKDRIIVFEDTDGDGKFNRRTVFMEKLNLVSGIEVGFGGVWIGAAPYLMFVPIQDGDEPKPAGEPKILLDGWAYQDTHETLNSFTWGPDGWLYGCQGVFTHSNVGKPGAPDTERTRINAGIWRYHPKRHIFEVFAEGTSNPWGIDFDERGQLFAEACVIPHLFQLAQGGRYHRQAGAHFNPFIYDDIKTIADHVHWAGNKGPHAGNSRSDSAGGGHAHAGLMIYQGDNWPTEYRGKIFIGNIHGQRINMDIPERKGSGYVGKHGKDFLNFNDKWSQVINCQSGPDGGVYFIDWYDKNQCHHNNADGHDRSNGRIYKVSYGDPKNMNVDLQKKSDADIVKLAIEQSDWSGRHARRILQERAAEDKKVFKEVARRIDSTKTPLQTLRLLWTLHATDSGAYALHNKDEFVRAWYIQLACESKPNWDNKTVYSGALKEFAQLAREDKSPVVRLYLASAAQRLPIEDRWEIIEGLYSHSEDAGDHNIPLMVWYAAEPLPTKDFTRALQLAENAKLPNILNFTVRRTAALNTPEAFAAITKTLNHVVGGTSSTSPTSNKKILDILNGLSLAFKGQRSAPMPEGWQEVESKLSNNPNPEIRAQVQSLSLTFGSSSALASLRKTLVDKSADLNARRTALDSLLSTKDDQLSMLLQQLLDDPALRSAAIRGLASYDDVQIPGKILASYKSFNPGEKRDALNTLASRATFAKPLLTAVAQDSTLKKDLSADLIRQLRSLKNDDLNKEIEKAWGAIRETTADKKQQITKYKNVFFAGGSQPGDASRGRAIFARTCQQCHTLFDEGGKVGPDLTGSNRGDLDYILENMVDPNAVMPNDYRASTLETKDDRVLTGIVKSQNDKFVTLLTANETVTIPRSEIVSLQQNQLSMMPEGLLEPLNDQEIRDLIYYLRQPGQVPLPNGGQ